MSARHPESATPAIVLAAGGTGGHMFPATALAEALIGRGHRVILVTDRRGSAFDDSPGVELHRIRASGIAGRGMFAKLRAGLLLVLGWYDANRLLARLNPAAIVGFGGYASVPTVVAAARRGIPVILHEQNAVLGRANRLLARKATAIATCFDNVRRIDPRDQGKVRLTGNPVREAVRAMRGVPAPQLLENGGREILVTGGSQGAGAFAELIPAAIACLPETMRGRLRIAQQAREPDVDRVAQAYARLDVSGDVRAFFDDMPTRLRAANLLICRAGASTVAENTVVGRPALLIPYPSAIDDHQTANARALEAAGGAITLTQAGLTAETLAERLRTLLDDTGRLAAMTAAAHAAGRPDAVDDLAELVLEAASLRRAEPAGAGPRIAPVARSAAA